MELNFEGRRIRSIEQRPGRIVITIDDPDSAPPVPQLGSKSPKHEMIALEELERRHVQFVLENSRTLEEAAHVLGINLSTLWRKRRQFHLD